MTILYDPCSLVVWGVDNDNASERSLERLEDVQPSLFETRLAQEYICFRTYLMVNFRGYMCVSLFFKYVFFYNPVLTECLGKESLPR